MGRALTGTHLYVNHQGNFSHYAEENCELCAAKARIATLEAELLEARDLLAARQMKHVADCVVRPLQGNESVAKSEIMWIGNRPVAGKLFAVKE